MPLTTGDRYKLNTDKLANRLMPIFLRGRRHVLWMQALLKPLWNLNNNFQTYVSDTELEAQMTSRVIQFKWYLNYLFDQYFVNPADEIYFERFEEDGTLLFDDGEVDEEPFVVYGISEDWSTEDPEDQPRPLWGVIEQLQIFGVLFKVVIPPLTIDNFELEELIIPVIERYRVAGKTYALKFL